MSICEFQLCCYLCEHVNVQTEVPKDKSKVYIHKSAYKVERKGEIGFKDFKFILYKAVPSDPKESCACRYTSLNA